jgi:tRNA(fMet)-specific endonuclease VapC
MTLWILDTDHISLFQTGHSLVIQKIRAVEPTNLGVTIVSLEEQMYGRLNRIRRAKSTEDLTLAYLNLNRTFAYFNTINVLDFDSEASACYQEMINKKIRVGTQDLKIAAIAKSLSAIIVTRNSRDFSKIPEIQIEDWSTSGTCK